MSTYYDYIIVGAGLAGCVLANKLSSSKKSVLIIDKRDHIAGNCFDTIDKHGILVQRYGPHIFHTNNKQVFDYISQFTQLNAYKHKVLAWYNDKYYPIPINRTTVNQFFNINLKNEKDMKQFLKNKHVHLKKIDNSRDVVVSRYGIELYNAFIKYYSKKQWGKYPHQLDASVLNRLPIRLNDNPYYFDDVFQGMPKFGFTDMCNKMLARKNVTVLLNVSYKDIRNNYRYKKLFYTGKIDEYFNYCFGKLQYRCSLFSFKSYKKKKYQPNVVVNFTGKDDQRFRITEFKHFYNIKSNYTTICHENSRGIGEPGYPIPDKNNRQCFELYTIKAEKCPHIIFAGRLGLYKYLNMDQVIEYSLSLANSIGK